MLTKVGLFAVFSLIILMIIPVYADVDKATINKETFTIDENFTILGTVSDTNRVTLLAAMEGPNDEKLIKTSRSDIGGTFSFVPISADLLFESKGIYIINVFTEFQKTENGTKIKISYEKGIATLLPNYDLELKEIGNKLVNETEELSFTASVTDSSIDEIEFRLEKQPSGATINKDTGAFSWTPTNTQSGGYIFDIVVKSGPLEDRETITVSVNDKPESEQTISKPEQTVSEPEETITKPDELEIPAPFVDESKSSQSYVDRYNSEARYKEWFDATYPEYTSIYEAVGLEAPKELAPFVDPELDPQYYIDRYNNEATYKEWFDQIYPEITIYEAVGLEEPVIKKVTEVAEFGECGEGTKLTDGVCTIIEEPEFGECGEGTKLTDGVCTIIGKSTAKPWWQFW